MHLTTKSRYAVRAMLDLATNAQEQPVSRAEIAKRQGISADYVAQLFGLLQKKGLVQGIKGPGGGYLLARPLDEIRIGDIVRAVEGPIELVHCTSKNGQHCLRMDSCVASHVWQEASSAMAAVFDHYSLYDLTIDPGACELPETA